MRIHDQVNGLHIVTDSQCGKTAMRAFNMISDYLTTNELDDMRLVMRHGAQIAIMISTLRAMTHKQVSYGVAHDEHTAIQAFDN